MRTRFSEKLRLLYNVKVETYDPQADQVIDTRMSHNIVTNVGRKWIRNLLGASAYFAAADPTPLDPGSGGLSGAERARYIGVGVGGALQTAVTVPPLLSTQTEVVTVTEIEDPVKILPVATTGTTDIWLKEIEAQTTSVYFPDDFTIVFAASLLETEVSFATQAATGGAVIGTSVPVSEVGLYISDADATLSPAVAPNNAKLIAYNIFAPITKTDSVILRVEWEFRL